MARVQILSKEEQKIFSLSAIFTYSQREYYFKLPNNLQKFVDTLRDSNNKIYFYLLFAYFKANYIFYTREQFWNDDILYLEETLDIPLLEPLEITFLDLQFMHILEFFYSHL